MNDTADGRGQRVYDPRGRIETQTLPRAPRVPDLSGLRLGVLDNTKWNARALLERVMTHLRTEHGLATVEYYRKQSFSKNAAPELIERIARANDLALTAIGD